MSKLNPSPIRAESVEEYAREVSKRATEDDLRRHIGGLKNCLDAEDWGHAADHADCVADALRKLDAIEVAQ